MPSHGMGKPMRASAPVVSDFGCDARTARHRRTNVLPGRPIVGYPVPTLYHILYVRAAKLVHAREGRPTLYLPCTDVPYFVCVPRQTKVGREVG